jgi:hypothetical protein
VIRDCRRLHEDLSNLIVRGDVGIVALPLAEVAVATAVVVNALSMLPPRRVVSDVLARELERSLAMLDDAIAETLRLPAGAP